MTKLTEDIDVMREAMLEKEQKLAALFKKTSKIMSEYEKETGEMIKQLHKARDEQVPIDKNEQSRVLLMFLYAIDVLITSEVPVKCKSIFYKHFKN